MLSPPSGYEIAWGDGQRFSRLRMHASQSFSWLTLDLSVSAVFSQAQMFCWSPGVYVLFIFPCVAVAAVEITALILKAPARPFSSVTVLTHEPRPLPSPLSCVPVLTNHAPEGPAVFVDIQSASPDPRGP